MSHIVTIKTELRDLAAIQAACRRLGIAAPIDGTHTVFTTQRAGLAIDLPGWRYPVVIDRETRELHYDNYQGNWGDISQLNKLKQAYAIEKARAEARRAGHTVSERRLADGSVQLTINA